MINFKTYSKYSIKHSIASIEKIVEAAQKDGDSSVAILDRGGLFSTIHLAKICQKNKLNPIIGYELKPDVLSIWPKTHEALRQFNKIFTEESKATKDISEYNFKDIVGIITHPTYYDWASKHFSEIYLEVTEEMSPETRTLYEEYAAKVGCKVIPVSKVLYNERADALAHDYYIDYTTGEKTHLDKDTYFIKSKNDFKAWANPLWIANAEELAQSIRLDIVLGKLRLPEFDGAPQNMSNFQYLESKCISALKQKGFHYDNKYLERLKHELKDVKEANLESYFLIVEDICTWAKNNDIYKGDGRGSGAGSLICYLLGITGMDPLEYGLLWERFYNAGRKGSLPDIDTDFEKDRRQEVISYITERWGEKSVYQIITFGSFGPAKALKVALSIGQCSFDEQNEISKLIHHKAETIAEALEKSPELKEEAGRRKALFSIAQRLEGAFESFGKHAAGVIIADEEFTNGGLPMQWHEGDQRYISALDLLAVEEYGLLKMDCLGLNTLNIVKRCEELIKEKTGKPFSMKDAPLNDEQVYINIFDSGKTKGIFQVESQLGQKYSKLIKPRSISDLADLVTIVRPGAMESGQTQQYLDVRDEKAVPTYPHPKLKKILGQTYSGCIYQEQVMQICTDIAGLDLKSADNVRRAAGKKKIELMKDQMNMFLEGCKKNDVTDEVANTLWSWIVKFSGYGFNKSHAVAYAYTTYATAYLKHHYPIEFFEASCNHAIGDLKRSTHDKIKEIIYDAKDFGIDTLLPSLKECNLKFKIEDSTKIRYGLAFIKDIGETKKEIFESCRNASNFSEFLTKALDARMNKKVIEALICSGALDHFKITRNTMLADYELINMLTDREYEAVLKEVSGSTKNVISIIKDMSDEEKTEARKALKLLTPMKTRRQKLRDIIANYKSKDKFESVLHIAMYERKFLGCDISVSETDSFFASITHNLSELKKITKPKIKVTTAIHIEGIRKIVTKSGQNPGQEMAFLTGSDGTAIYDSMVVFPTQYKKFKPFLTEGRVVYIDGETSQNGGLIVNNIGILN